MGDEHGGAALRAVDTEAAADDVSAFPEPGKPAARSERRAAASVVFDAEFQAAVDALGGDLDAGRLSMPHRVRAGFPGDQIGGLFHVGSETGIGIVAAVGRLLADHGYDISYSQQFDDRQSNRFFMRVEASAPQSADLDRLRREFGRVVASFSMKWFLGASNDETRTLLMVSHADRYIKELIDLSQSGLLKIEIAGIVGTMTACATSLIKLVSPFITFPSLRSESLRQKRSCCVSCRPKVSNSWCWPVTCRS